MSVSQWFRRLLAPRKVGSSDTPEPGPDAMIGAPGVSAYAGLEDAAAVEAVEQSTDPPSETDS